MGCSSSNTAAARADHVVNRIQQEDALKEKQIHKILLLGPGDSGKSTVYKQLVKIYGGGFSAKKRKALRRSIHENIIAAMKMLLDACVGSQERKHEGVAYQCSLGDDLKVLQAAKFIDLLQLSAPVDQETIDHIRVLWAEPGLQNALKCRDTFQFPFAVDYYIDRLDDVASKNYIPTFEDLLHSRNRTTGIIESDLTVDGHSFKIVDVGGQRSERRKWIHCFEGVTTVIFVAAISEYDQVLLEDPRVNRLEEAIELFEEICNLHWFTETPIITFLNKIDIFHEKHKRLPFRPGRAFSTYDCPDPPVGDEHSPPSSEEVYDFMKKLMLARDKSTNRSVYVHPTCATDSESIQTTFNLVKEAIIDCGLSKTIPPPIAIEQKITLKNEWTYEGPTVHDLPHGFGVGIYEAKHEDFQCEYRGQWRNGEFHGTGKLVETRDGTKSVTEGDWKHDIFIHPRFGSQHH